MRRGGLVLGACALACAPASQPPQPADASPPAAEPAPPDMSPAPGPSTAAPAPAPLQLPANAGLRVVLDLPAWDILAMPSRLVTVDPDFLHLTARDAATGAVQWTAQVQPDSQGWHTLFGLGDAIVLLAGPRRIHVDAATGAVRGTRRGFYHGADRDCRLELSAGDRTADWSTWIPATPAPPSCAQSCGCSLGVFDCSGATDAATSFHNQTTHLYRSLREPHDTVCFDRPAVLARGAAHVVVRAQDEQHTPTVMGLDATTYTRVWTRPDLATTITAPEYSGADPSGQTCWIGGDTNLLGFACATGATRWRVRFAADDAKDPGEADVAWQRAGLFMQHRDGERALVELRGADGKRRWRRTLPADHYAITEHTQLGYMSATVPIAAYALLDPSTGATIATIPVTDKQSFVRTSDGYARLGPDTCAEFDARGRPLREVKFAGDAIVRVTADHLVERTADRLRVIRRGTLAPVLTLTGKWSLRDSTAALPPEVLVLHEHRGESTPRVLVLRP